MNDAATPAAESRRKTETVSSASWLETNPGRRRKILAIVAVFVTTLLAAFAVAAVGPTALELAFGLPVPAAFAIAIGIMLGAAYFSYRQVLAFRELQRRNALEAERRRAEALAAQRALEEQQRRDQAIAEIRKTYAPVVHIFGGSADMVADSAPRIPQVLQDIYDHCAYDLRFVPSNTIGQPTMDGQVARLQVSAGNKRSDAMRYREIERPRIVATTEKLRDRLRTQHSIVIPAAAQHVGGVHNVRGSTAISLYSMIEEACFTDSSLPITWMLHEPMAPQVSAAQGAKPLVTVLAKQGDGGRSSLQARKDLVFPIPLPPGLSVGPAATDNGDAKRQRPTLMVGKPRDQIEAIQWWLRRFAKGLVLCARVRDDHDKARLDDQVRPAMSVIDMAALLDTSKTATKEARALMKDAGPGLICSPSPVYHVPSYESLPSLVQKLGAQGVRTLEGFAVAPGDRSADGRPRRMLLFGYGEVAIGREIADRVRDALEVDPNFFFPCVAGVPGMNGFEFILVVEMSQHELKDALGSVCEGEGWDAFLQDVEIWKKRICDQPSAQRSPEE